MEIEYIDFDKLENARNLQKHCRELNILPPPLMSFTVSKFNKDNNKIREIKSKSNSYVRNAYNYLSFCLGFSSSESVVTNKWGDGIISYKGRSGSIFPTFGLTISTLWPKVAFGSGTTKDTVNDYQLENQITWSDLGVSSTSEFDPIERKLITKLITERTNTTNTIYNISEVGIFTDYQGIASAKLMVRDVFPTITLARDETIKFVYETEIYFI